jgi:uncharacterized protein (TIGR00255 family)
MTGYASGQSAAPCHPPLTLAVELRGVNGRFLDLALRLPEELRAHEPALRQLLTARLARGKVELRVTLQAEPSAELRDVPPATLQRLAALQEQVRGWLPGAASLSVADVLRVADSAIPIAQTGLGQAALGLTAQVLTEFIAARQREGARLAALLGERVAQLRALALQAAPLVPQLIEAQKQRFLQRWAEALGSAEVQPADPQAAQERALAEATAFAIRIDVAEELERLAAHLEEIERTLERGGETGKRLDFLIQELHREANTLGSKSPALELTRIAVDMKVLIEQMREQVQNVE